MDFALVVNARHPKYHSAIKNHFIHNSNDTFSPSNEGPTKKSFCMLLMETKAAGNEYEALFQLSIGVTANLTRLERLGLNGRLCYVVYANMNRLHYIMATTYEGRVVSYSRTVTTFFY